MPTIGFISIPRGVTKLKDFYINNETYADINMNLNEEGEIREVPGAYCVDIVD